MNIPITKPCFDDREKTAIGEVLDSGWVVQGPKVAKFEELFTDFTGTAHSRAVTSCTTALHLSLTALGVGRGDKVIVPSFTYIASANAVEYTGAEVVFCDIDLLTFNIDTVKAEELLKADKDIKAIMPVHLFGLPADMKAVMELAGKHDLHVIEDAACALGSRIDGRHVGTFGDTGCFSFHPRKAITTGEGGMITTNNAELDKRLSSLRDHGASKSDLERHRDKGGSLLPNFKVLGYNYRMTDLQGALGTVQMAKAEEIIAGRLKIAKMYDSALKDIEDLKIPYVPEGYTHSYQSYVSIFTCGKDTASFTKESIDELNIRRNEFMERLEAKSIATRQGTHAVHTLSYYKDKYSLSDTDFLSSYAADRLSVTLPLYATMTDEEFSYVIDNIKEELS